VPAAVSENQAAVEKLREKTGCFVLLTNVPVEEKQGLEILRIYRDTVKPTSFMMASKFSPVFVGVKGDRRFLFTPLDHVQLAYLNALDVHPAIFTKINILPSGTGCAGYH